MTERKKEEDQKTHPVSWMDVARFSWHYWQPQRGLGAVSVALMLLSVTMDAIVPVYTGKIIDAMATMPAVTTATAAVSSAWSAVWVFAVVLLLHHALRNG